MNIFRKYDVLVIGGVHIDIFADYNLNDKNKVDKIGNIHFSIGGTAYNLVSNLALRNVKVSVCTILNIDSQFTPHIIYKLKSLKVNTEYIQAEKSNELSAFVAIRENGELISAVTNNIIENFPLESSLIEKAVSEHSLIVADCNLNDFQLNDVIKVCNYLQKPVIVAAVSDSKVERLKSLESDAKIDILAMNLAEAKSFFEANDLTAIEALMISNKYNNFRTIIITLGKDGYIIREKNTILKFASPLQNPSSTSGAGDALLSCAIYTKLKEDEPDWNKSYNKISLFINKALKDNTATYNSLLSLNRIIKKNKRLTIEIIIAIIGLIVTAIIGIIQIWIAK